MRELLKSGRVGTFNLNRKFIDSLDPDVVFNAFQGMFIVRCEHNFATDCFEYIAFNQMFDVVEEGFLPTEYFLQVVKEKSNYSEYTYFKWVKR
ncbi:MAG: hypothetical protein EKK64_03745 [Neisseriaceae bacterium]|nr:MAG: hypothetical protein EKK64_03745 [Neisseriaceae bacterium]